MTSCGARAIALSARLAAGSVAPGDVVILLGRHSIEAAIALLGCLHRGVVLAPLPPMFNVTQLSALSNQTRAKGIIAFGGEKEIAKCELVAHDVDHLITLRPETIDELIAEEAPDDRTSRDADDLTLVMHSSGTTSAPKGIVHSSNTLRYATEGICRRWAALAATTSTSSCASSASSAALVFGYFPVLLQRRHRRAR